MHGPATLRILFPCSSPFYSSTSLSSPAKTTRKNDQMDAAQLLGNTLSPDAAVRQDAESQLETASKENYPQYMTMLSSALQDNSIPTHIRSAAGLALKNALSAREASRLESYSQRWLALDDASRTTVKTNVLSTLPSDDNRAGTAAAQVISAIASIELPVGHWNDLITNLLNAVGNAENSKLRMAALQAIGFTCESVPSHVLTAQSNEILTAVIQGARKEEPVPAVRLAALQALYNSLEFVSANFENPGERNYIMQIVCEATQTAVAPEASREEREALEGIKINSFECLVRIMNLYYDKMRPYVEQALFGLTVLGMRDPEPKVALQAIEFWSTVCEAENELALEAEEAREFGEEPERVSFNFARVALTELLPVLCDLLKIQDEDTDEDEWTVSKAAGTCITLLASVVTDEIVPLALPFIENNIKDADWRSRDAAVMCFGSIMDGPRSESLAPLVEQALPTIIEMLRDSSVAVKDTAAWTLGRITDLLGETIKADVHLESLVSGLLQGLLDESRIITNCCWALMNLFTVHGGNALGEEGEVESSVASTSPMSRFFDTVIQSLLSVSDRANNDSNCRTSAYEALASAVSNCAADCLPQASNVLLQVVERQEKLNGMMSQLVGIDDSRNWADMQSNLCSVIMASVRRIGKDIEPLGDRLMTSLLTTMQQCQNAKMSSVLEDAFLAVGAIIAALESGFEKYLGAFLPFMITALGNSAEHALCAIAVGLIGDICRALGEGAKGYCEGFMNTLFANLQNADLDRAVKPPILSCFGDVALAIGANFEPYLQTTMAVLAQAGSIVAPQDVVDYDMIDYVNTLREGIAEAYTGIVAGLRSGNRPDLLQAHVDSIFNFLSLINAHLDRTELLLRSSLGLLGDLAACYGGALKGHVSQSWVPELIKAGRTRNNSIETRKVASWAREEVKKASA